MQTNTILQKLIIICLTISLSACGLANSSREDKLATGAIVGALAGSVIGYNIIGSGMGRVFGAGLLGVGGAFAGFYAADYLTRYDKAAMESAAYSALIDENPGDLHDWQNPDNGTSGSYMVLRTFLNEDGKICRVLNAKLTHNDQTREEQQTLCQTHDGNWMVM